MSYKLYNKFVKLPKDFGLHLKNIKNLFLARNILFTFNIRIKNLKWVNIQNIIKDNNSFITHF
jgi:hypothetical protein